MDFNVSIKNAELADSRKAVIKSKWTKEDVNIDVIIEDLVYSGCCSIESIRKNSETIGVSFEVIKKALSDCLDDQINISYEVDEVRKKFNVVARENIDSEDVFAEIIYLTASITKKEPHELIPMLTSMLQEMNAINIELNKQTSISNQIKTDISETNKRFDSLLNQKKLLDEKINCKFIKLLNTKKRKIASLTRELDKLNRSKIVANFSSDLDQSDASSFHELKQSSVSTQESSFEVEEPQPSTSKTPSKPPSAKKKLDMGEQNISHMPATATRTQQKQRLFTFKKGNDSSKNSSLENMEIVIKKDSAPKIINEDNLKTFEGFKCKVTPKKALRVSREQSQSPLEYESKKNSIISDLTKLNDSQKNKSQSSDDNDNFDHQDMQFTQDLMDKSPFRLKKYLKASLNREADDASDSSTDADESSKNIETTDFSADESPANNDEIIPSSQPESKSIFNSLLKRKSSSPFKISTQKKSKFDADTIDIYDQTS